MNRWSIEFAALLLIFEVGAVHSKEPQVETLVPGLSVKRLPVALTNIDSVEYGPDGRLFAAGYDGKVHVLTDTNGDGLEDKSDVYWSKPGDLPHARGDPADGPWSLRRGPWQNRLVEGHRWRRTSR